jgi:hypothetical protein
MSVPEYIKKFKISLRPVRVSSVSFLIFFNGFVIKITFCLQPLVFIEILFFNFLLIFFELLNFAYIASKLGIGRKIVI